MRFRLDVPFREKELVKPFGARFDFAEKYWYYEGERLPDALRGWYRGQSIPGSGDVPAASSGREAGTPGGTSPGRERSAGSGAWSDPGMAASAGRKVKPDPEAIAAGGYLTVSQVNAMIAGKYESDAAFRLIRVCGEVTNLSHRSDGHYYFSIKDERAILQCVMWNSYVGKGLKFELEQGQQVGVIGNLTFYAQQGKTELLAFEIVNVGEGEASLRRQALKKKLEAEGLFDEQYKKEIPKSPKAVGVVTAAHGQAIRDICAIAGQRDPYVRIVLYPVKVQGKLAVETTVAGIRFLDSYGLDTIIVGRGGGSTEELSVYDDEAIVRAVFAARTPIISAVGHEGNWTLIDYAADRRVATPTDAARIAFPDVMELLRRVDVLEERARLQMKGCLERRRLQLKNASAKLAGFRPELVILDKQRQLDQLSERMRQSVWELLKARESQLQVDVTRLRGLTPETKLREREQQLLQLSRYLKQSMLELYREREKRWQLLTERLNGLSPTAKLVDGFGYISKDGVPVRSVSDVKETDQVTIRMHDGEIAASVTGVRSGQNTVSQKHNRNNIKPQPEP